MELKYRNSIKRYNKYSSSTPNNCSIDCKQLKDSPSPALKHQRVTMPLNSSQIPALYKQSNTSNIPQRQEPTGIYKITICRSRQQHVRPHSLANLRFHPNLVIFARENAINPVNTGETWSMGEKRKKKKIEGRGENERGVERKGWKGKEKQRK